MTVVGTLGVVVASLTLFPAGHFLAGFLVVAFFLLGDGLDGTLARITGRESRFGAFLDSTLDRLADAAVFGGLIANVFANTLGFPLLSGGGARYRIYSMVGVSFSVVARLIVMSWLTMWSGILFVLGLALTLEPTTQYPVFPHHYIDRLVGLGVLVALSSFIIWLARKRRRRT